ncbi:hypothetical protein H0E87_029808 [Populus deltoides]|uniref:Uncharacterized protein n=1 Tax=Populus deltoides TaxID=3696 RepID=A0A8T2WNR9_POPDE|nr:hypothetical protein H0E87_029808 [Populus deltoides]
MSPETQHQNHSFSLSCRLPCPSKPSIFVFFQHSTGIGLLPQENSTHLLLDSGGSSMTNTDFRRSVYGLKEEVDEHAFPQNLQLGIADAEEDATLDCGGLLKATTEERVAAPAVACSWCSIEKVDRSLEVQLAAVPRPVQDE